MYGTFTFRQKSDCNYNSLNHQWNSKNERNWFLVFGEWPFSWQTVGNGLLVFLRICVNYQILCFNLSLCSKPTNYSNPTGPLNSLFISFRLFAERFCSSVYCFWSTVNERGWFLLVVSPGSASDVWISHREAVYHPRGCLSFGRSSYFWLLAFHLLLVWTIKV